jgi:hypothetical protein
VESWGAARYGDPCRECGYDWSLSTAAALDLVAAVPARYAALLGDADGSARHPELEWTAGGYVAHVVDNLRIWAERLAGASLGGSPDVPGYDEQLLAAARRYDALPVAGSLWSLQRAVDAWLAAVERAVAEDVELRHEARGVQRVSDVVRNNAHDAFHHEWDIRRSV